MQNHEDKDWLAAIDRDLTELAQAAGESWGHVWPKPEQDVEKANTQ